MVVARWASHTQYGHPTNETAITPPDNASAAAAISRDAMRRGRRPGLSSVHPCARIASGPLAGAQLRDGGRAARRSFPHVLASPAVAAEPRSAAEPGI